MELLREINKAVNEKLSSDAIITENLRLIAEHAKLKPEQLNESITQWLAKVKNVVRDEKLQPQQVENTATILAALMSLANKQDEEAFNVKDLGSVLYNVENPQVDPKVSKESLITLRGIGQYQNTYKQQALEALNDPGSISNFIGKIQATIEPVMNRNMSKETQRNTTNVPPEGDIPPEDDRPPENPGTM